MTVETASSGLLARPSVVRVTSWRWSAPLFAFVLYLAGSMVIQHNALAHFNSGCACYGFDPAGFIWAFAWWPHALLHLPHNPFITQDIWTPGGLNLATNTSVPTLALIGIPITWIFGPTSTYNFWMILAPVTGGFCAYRLCLALTRRELPAIAGGWLYGFSTYETTQMMGHLNLEFAFIAPAMILLVIRCLDGTISRRRFSVLLGLVVLLEMGISTEVLFTATVAGIILLLSVLVFAPSELRRAVLGLLPWIAGGYVLAAIVTSPFIYYALHGAPAGVGMGANFGDDLFAFFVPAVSTALGGSSYAYVTAHFTAGLSENNAYLGFPLIGIIAAMLARLWRDWRVRVLLSTMFVLFVWSLASHLQIKGVWQFALPFKLLAGHKFFDQMLPNRIALYTELGAAVIAALWLTWTAVPLLLRWLVVIAAAVFLFPNIDGPYYQGVYVVPKFFTTDTYKRYIHPNDVVLPLPFGPYGTSLLWQVDTHFDFKLASGDFSVPIDYLSKPGVTDLLDQKHLPTPQKDGHAVRQFLIAYHVNEAVIPDGYSPGWASVFTSLGATQTAVGGVDVFHFTAPL